MEKQDLKELKKEPVTFDQLEEKYKELLCAYANLTEDMAASVKDTQGMLAFLVLQCGIIRTAITKDISKDPLAPISIVNCATADKDLLYLFNSNLCFVNALKTSNTVEEAMTEWQKSINKF